MFLIYSLPAPDFKYFSLCRASVLVLNFSVKTTTKGL